VKTLFKLSVISASLLAVTSSFAASPSNAQLQKEIRAIMQHNQKLQHEVSMLKTRLETHQSTTATEYKGRGGSHVGFVRTGKNLVHRSSPSSVLQTANRPSTVLTDRFEHSVTVTTSPLQGAATGGPGNILEQMSKGNQQLTLLQQRAALMRQLHKEGDNDLYRPIMELSGGLEGQLYAVDGFGKNSEPRGINLATAEFDVNGIVGPWANAFMALDYDNSPVSSGNRSPKGTVYLDRGFVTLGNLNRFPVYVSTGEMYVPYGRYGSLMLTTPLVESLARTKSDTALVGFYDKGIYGELFAYNGSQTSGGNHIFKQGGFDVGVKRNFGPNASDSYRVGASVESNLADSQGLQSTGVNTNTGHFQGFASGTNNNIQHRVPAFALYGNATYKRWTFIAQFVRGFKSFAVSDLAYGNTGSTLSGANPGALHTELNYTIHFWNKPFTFGADYDESWEALAANLPKRSFAADISTTWFRNTVETIEYRHDDDYGSGKAANGAGGTQFSGTGKTRNSYIAQLGVYF
jgi:hypothetical protein